MPIWIIAWVVIGSPGLLQLQAAPRTRRVPLAPRLGQIVPRCWTSRNDYINMRSRERRLPDHARKPLMATNSSLALSFSTSNESHETESQSKDHDADELPDCEGFHRILPSDLAVLPHGQRLAPKVTPPTQDRDRLFWCRAFPSPAGALFLWSSVLAPSSAATSWLSLMDH